MIAARKLLIGTNLKMYKTIRETASYLEDLDRLTGDIADDLLLFVIPSYTALATASDSVHGSKILLGAQNMHWLNEGPYTGQTSPTMLVSIGCRHVLLGHSEPRLYFSETYERVNLKLKAAINHGITPIVCFGEMLAEREDLQTADVLRTQVRTALRNISASEARRLVVAYEPIWAIGTGSTAHPDVAEQAHGIIREELAHCCGVETAEKTRILYGGSVKPDNIGALMAQPDIDGALVGGASLVPTTFANIVKYA